MPGKAPERDRQVDASDNLIAKHGGYRGLKTFQLAEVIYDVTVRFCDKYIDSRSRTHDQMVQAARSGRQNIAEGSMDSGTSKKLELKLTGVARGSLEELRLDYEDYLRQCGLPQWKPNHPSLTRFKSLRCSSLEQFRAWVADEARRAKDGTDQHRQARTDVAGSRISDSLCASVFVANGALSLLNLCVFLLDRQVKALADAFEREGGFTERLYRRRMQRRASKPD